MSLHEDALSLLTGWPAPNSRQDQLRQRYVDHLRAHPDGLTRESRPDHLTASTVILSADASAVLLTLHAKARRWFQFGGHCEPGDATLAAAARREATEESGLADLQFDPVPVQLSEHAVPFCGPRGDVHHLDVRFVAVAADGEEHQVSDESLDVRWWPVGDLPDPEADLVELVFLAGSRVGSQSTSTAGSTASSAPGAAPDGAVSGSSRAPAE